MVFDPVSEGLKSTLTQTCPGRLRCSSRPRGTAEGMSSVARGEACPQPEGSGLKVRRSRPRGHVLSKACARPREICSLDCVLNAIVGKFLPIHYLLNRARVSERAGAAGDREEVERGVS
ncbi:hypothetical protein JZ751_028642 [Albula glossodonta]|uniref:Uncharacterized protein n=1 Tax=Albula glossodonta TaxID=121402 RepID=A0A8T2MPC5_9TELE|nr:hypothetical protein JZ751_028642 [Albula glossodonta]